MSILCSLPPPPLPNAIRTTTELLKTLQFKKCNKLEMEQNEHMQVYCTAFLFVCPLVQICLD